MLGGNTGKVPKEGLRWWGEGPLNLKFYSADSNFLSRNGLKGVEERAETAGGPGSEEDVKREGRSSEDLHVEDSAFLPSREDGRASS